MKPLTAAGRDVIEVVRAALEVVPTLPPDEQHLVREAIAAHLHALGRCGHGLSDEVDAG